jgi:hypothetical protein
LNFDNLFNGTDSSASETSHAEVLTMFAQFTDKWITLSLAVRDGKITAQEAVNSFDLFVAPISMILLVANEAGIIDLKNL